MGDPTDPGEDQETTIVIEGPPENAKPEDRAKFDEMFEKFRAEMSAVLKKYHATPLKARLRRIVYVKKGAKE
jgi:hypothetical protein